MSTVRDTVRSQLWPLPLVAVVLAVVAGIFVPRLDGHVDATLPSWLASVLFGGDPGAARTVLDAVSSSLITVTSLTFSLTVVTLQLASSQFSPRLLRTFTSDVFVQATLGLFLATFTYSLTVLRAVRSGSGSGSFVPEVAVTVSFLLAVASVIGLVVFLAHLARQIRVETMLRDVHEDASATITAVLPGRDQSVGASVPAAPPHATRLLAARSGFVVRFDEHELLCAATEADAYVVIDCRPGSSVVAATPIGWAWARQGILDSDAKHDLDDRITAAIKTGYERTAAQDVGYGLRQLTDVTNKALSPGINDPTTAIHALGHIAALLSDLSDRQLGAITLTDDDGRARVLLARPGFADLVEESLTQPRRYGSSDPQVMARMFLLLEQLAWRVHPDQSPVIAGQLERLEASVADADFDATERAQLAQAANKVRSVLASPALTQGKDAAQPPASPGETI